MKKKEKRKKEIKNEEEKEKKQQESQKKKQNKKPRYVCRSNSHSSCYFHIDSKRKKGFVLVSSHSHTDFSRSQGITYY